MRHWCLLIIAAGLLALTGCEPRITPSSPAYGVPAVEVTAATFQGTVLQSNQPVLLDCYATWCGPCKMMEPILEELAADYQGRVVVARIDTDQHGSTISGYGVQYLPTFLVFVNGEVVDKLEGAYPKSELSAALDKALGSGGGSSQTQ